MLKLLIGLIMTMLFIGCGAAEKITSLDTNETLAVSKVTVDETESVTETTIGAVNEDIPEELTELPNYINFRYGDGNIEKRSVSFTTDDILKQSTKACIQIFKKDSYDIYLERCSFVVNDVYPDFSFGLHEISEGSYKGSIYVKDESGRTIARGSNKIFDIYYEHEFYSNDFLLEDVYMGKFVNVYDLYKTYYVFDSDNPGMFAKEVSFVNEHYVDSYVNEYETEGGLWGSFYISANTRYDLICIGTDCAKFPSDFDMSSYEIDLSTFEKVKMNSVISDDICSISYDEDYVKTYSLDNVYDYIEIKYCKQDVNVKIVATNFEDELEYYFNWIYNGSDWGDGQFSFTKDQNYGYISFYYEPLDFEKNLNTHYSPFIDITLSDPSTGEVLQTESVKLNGIRFCDDIYTLLGKCTLNGGV